MAGKLSIGPLGLVHEDNRRSIQEFNGVDRSIQQFRIKESIPLGNHFHKGKSETFLLVSGSGFLASCDVSPKDGKQTSEVEIQEIKEGEMVHIPAYTAHTFRFRPGSHLLCFSSTPFDENNKDLNPFTLDVPLFPTAPEVA